MGQLYFAFKSTPPQTGPNDPIYFSKHDKLTDSPNLGDYVIPTPLRRGIGPNSRRPASNHPLARRIGPRKKSSRSERRYKRVNTDVRYNSSRHTREYVWNAHEEIITVPAPSQLQRSVPTLEFRQLPTGVFHTFTTFPDVEPVVTITTKTADEKLAEMRAHFPVVGK